MKVYHRLGNPLTQSVRTAVRQRISGEVWGGVPRGSDTAAVQAYLDPLPYGREGIEFTVALAPNQTIGGLEARWSYRGAYRNHLREVGEEPDRVALQVMILKTVYGCRK